MGLRTELYIDGDRCRDCGSLLAERGSVLDRQLVIRNGMIIEVYDMLCLRCATITEVEYRGELLPSERMQELLGIGRAKGLELAGWARGLRRCA